MSALARVEARGAYAARLLGAASPMERELVLGVLRWQGTLDALLQPFLRRPVTSLDPVVRAALRVGLFESARLDTPVPVAVAEAVRVTIALAPRASGLVNAVLRRAAAAPWPDPADEGLPLALRFSHPEWLVDRWRALLGEERLREALAADQQPAPLWLLTGAGVPAGTAGDALEAHPFVAGVAAVREGVAAAVAALSRGEAYAMDPTAVVVARLLPSTGGPVADLAAAPGGKSLVLALERPGVPMVAGDRHPGRVAMLRRTLGRAPAPPAVIVADAGAPPLPDGRFQAVLLDAPCSGTGTLRRHPEIRWRLEAPDLAALAVVQRALAEAALALLAPGGVLLYATCSLEPEENAGVLAGLDAEPVSVAPRLPAAQPRVELPGGGAVLPPTPAGDGFTVHLLRRRS